MVANCYVYLMTSGYIYITISFLYIATSTYQRQFARDSQATIKAKFADFQTKVCEKLVKNRVKMEAFRVYVVNLFPPGDFIPSSPTNLFEIFETITQHGLWNYLHYSPLVKIVEKFGAGDSEMEGWVEEYKNNLKAYRIVTKVENYVDTYLHNFPSEESTRYGLQKVEWKMEFMDQTLEYLTEVWKLFSSHYLGPDSPPTALLDRVLKGCFSVTWLVPSHLITTLIKEVKTDTAFFQQHRIIRVTVGEECVYEEVVGKSALVSFA